MQTEIHPLILNNLLFYILSYAPGIIWQEDPAWWNNCSAQGALTIPRVLIQFLEPKYDHDVRVSIVSSSTLGNFECKEICQEQKSELDFIFL